jgi:hypothetical protein
MLPPLDSNARQESSALWALGGGPHPRRSKRHIVSRLCGSNRLLEATRYALVETRQARMQVSNFNCGLIE